MYQELLAQIKAIGIDWDTIDRLDDLYYMTTVIPEQQFVTDYPNVITAITQGNAGTKIVTALQNNTVASIEQILGGL